MFSAYTPSQSTVQGSPDLNSDGESTEDPTPTTPTNAVNKTTLNLVSPPAKKAKISSQKVSSTPPSKSDNFMKALVL